MSNSLELKLNISDDCKKIFGLLYKEEDLLNK